MFRPTFRRSVAAAFAAFAALSVVPMLAAPASAADTVLWDGDFDSGSLPAWSSSTACSTSNLSPYSPSDPTNQYGSVEALGNLSSACPSVALTSAGTRHGDGRALRVVMPPGAQRATPASKYQWSTDDSGRRTDWIGLSVKFETSEAGQPWSWMSPIALRAAGPSGHVVQMNRNQELELRRSTTAGSWPDGLGQAPVNLGPITAGVWTDYVFRFTWSDDSATAVREAWRNGKYLGKSTAPTIHGSDTYRLRVGMYQDTATSFQRVVSFDEVRMGTSYAAVDPSRGSTAPAPAPAPAPEPTPTPTPTPTAPTTGTSAPAFVAGVTGTPNAVEATAYSFKLPTGLSQGDQLVASVSYRGRPTVSAPRGWTRVLSTPLSSTMTQEVWSRKCASDCAAGTSETWSLSSGNGIAGVLLGYRGVDGVTPVDVHAFSVNSASTKSKAPSVVTTRPNTRIVALHSTIASAPYTAPSGMAERGKSIDTAGTYRASMGASDATVPAVGATGDKIGVFSATAQNIGVLLALRPVSG